MFCSFRAISPFHTVFSKDLYCRHVKSRACLEKGYNYVTLYHTIPRVLTTLKKNVFENIVRNEENAGNQHFSPICFQPFKRKK